MSSSASMLWMAPGSPATAAAMHARISSASPAGRSAGSTVRAASASIACASAGRPMAIDAMPRTLIAAPRAIGSRSSGSARSSSATAWPTRPASAEDARRRDPAPRAPLRVGIELGGALRARAPRLCARRGWPHGRR